MKIQPVIVHYTAIREQDPGYGCFDLSVSQLYPKVYAGEYRATLQGSVLTLTHKRYDFIVRKFNISYDIIDRKVADRWYKTVHKSQAGRIMQNMVMLQVLRTMKEINGAD